MSMKIETTRRAMLSGTSLALAPLMVGATPPPVRGEVELAFAEWKAIRRAINAATNDDYDEGDHPIWHRLKRAEHIIRDSDETGPRVAEIRMWLSLTGDLVYRTENDAMDREDVDWLMANADEPELSTIMALRAIKALRGAA
jgi:hypothetical protein